MLPEMCVEPEDAAAVALPVRPFGPTGPPLLARVVGLADDTLRRVTLSLGIARSA